MHNAKDEHLPPLDPVGNGSLALEGNGPKPRQQIVAWRPASGKVGKGHASRPDSTVIAFGNIDPGSIGNIKKDRFQIVQRSGRQNDLMRHALLSPQR